MKKKVRRKTDDIHIPLNPPSERGEENANLDDKNTLPRLADDPSHQGRGENGLGLDGDGFPVCERGKRLEEMGDVVVVSHRKLAIWSLVILVPLQVVMILLVPVVFVWVFGRWVVEGFSNPPQSPLVQGGKKRRRWKFGVLGWRLVMRWGWPFLVFLDWFTANECLKRMMGRCR